MPGLLLKTQARARRFSLAVLVVYAAILLLAFGHRCDPNAAAYAGGPKRQVLQIDSGDHATSHGCPVCAWQRDNISTAAHSGFLTLPALLSVEADTALVAIPLTRAFLTHTPRGPPLS